MTIFTIRLGVVTIYGTPERHHGRDYVRVELSEGDYSAVGKGNVISLAAWQDMERAAKALKKEAA